MNDKKLERLRKRRDRNRRVNIWVGIGAIVLIVLLIAWLTIADLWGDTDVAAMVPVLSVF